MLFLTSPVFFRHTLANTPQTRSNWLESHYTYQFQPIWCINLAGIDIFYTFAAKLHGIYVEFYWQKRRNSVATCAFTVSEIRVCGSAAAWILKKLINDRGGCTTASRNALCCVLLPCWKQRLFCAQKALLMIVINSSSYT